MAFLWELRANQIGKGLLCREKRDATMSEDEFRAQASRRVVEGILSFGRKPLMLAHSLPPATSALEHCEHHHASDSCTSFIAVKSQRHRAPMPVYDARSIQPFVSQYSAFIMETARRPHLSCRSMSFSYHCLLCSINPF